ncbi:DUF211 domain-containing protein [Halobaculum lipolyticum]|uniref:DUF211 domain-containing protein n=1 Tax=Halobaculum lipolyticum TaxID=3032001 RepID=A0ABD5W922_9EURY|nr:DUF211 domain-containing protein [Halobaculum sp. DT31]
MAVVRRVVVDVLKPHAPPLVEFTARVGEAAGVDSARVRLVELDRDVQTVAVTVEGDDVDYDAVAAALEGLGASIHSVDEVVCGDLPARPSGSIVGDDRTGSAE